jgi:BirA family biotin operon repressor/biotin-[acetyl-CoA-carboxylase] ligase
LIESVFNAMAQFAVAGFAPFIDTWQRFDWLRGQRIRIELTDELVPGVAQGIDVDGTLILETETGRRRIVSGSVLFGG